MTDKIEVFICYAHKDEALMRELEGHLNTLVRQNLIIVWHDRKVVAGTDWKQEVNKHLNSAHIILLLVSANFLASDYSYVEVERVMERYKAGKAHVIPVILRPVSWRGSAFGELTPLPKDGKPITSSTWHNHDEAFFDVVEGIEKSIAQLQIKEKNNSPPSAVNEGSHPPEKERPMSQKSSVQGSKIFDVFLCHNNKDKPEVKQIAHQLKARGLHPWLDEWEMRPGLPWQRALDASIEQIDTVAVFIGKDGIGPWQQMEVEAYLRKFVSMGCPVIPVLLRDAPEKPQLPIFLQGMHWVDFRKTEPEPLGQLVWGVTGKNPNDGSFVVDDSSKDGGERIAITPSVATSAMASPSSELQRLQRKQKSLQRQYDEISEKMEYLNSEYNRTAHAPTRFELKKQIEDEEAKIAKIEAELSQVEQRIASLPKQ